MYSPDILLAPSARLELAKLGFVGWALSV